MKYSLGTIYNRYYNVLNIKSQINSESLSSTYLIHFSMPTKPWQSRYQSEVIPKMLPELAEIVDEWIAEADRVCGFGFPQDWVEAKVQSKSDPKEFYYYQGHEHLKGKRPFNLNV